MPGTLSFTEAVSTAAAGLSEKSSAEQCLSKLIILHQHHNPPCRTRPSPVQTVLRSGRQESIRNRQGRILPWQRRCSSLFVSMSTLSLPGKLKGYSLPVGSSPVLSYSYQAGTVLSDIGISRFCIIDCLRMQNIRFFRE